MNPNADSMQYTQHLLITENWENKTHEGPNNTIGKIKTNNTRLRL